MRFSLLIAVLSISTLLSAQTAPDSLILPGFSVLRAEEDYRFLRSLTPELSGTWAKLKYIPLGENTSLSVGGDWRTEFQLLRNEQWVADNNDKALFQRFMLHTDWRLGERWRIFAQLKSAHTIGRNGPPFFLNVDRLDWHQLFLAFEMGENSTIEIGRRELLYGSRRLISVREGTNVRQSFDGARWIWQRGAHRLDFLAYAYNPQQIGVFDNSINTDQLLWGIYYVRKGASGMHFDAYYLGVKNESPRFEAGTEQELRHSLGVRHWGQLGQFRYNNEAIVQVGRQASRDIWAWTLSTELSYQLEGRLQLAPGLKAEIISGDKNAADGRLQTFNALYPRGGYFGLLAVIGPANLIDLHPSISLQPAAEWSLNVDWDVFWRHQRGDGLYFPSGRLNVAGSASPARFIGHQAGVQLGRTISRFLEVEASYFYFFAGPFLEDVTEGADFSQFGMSLNYKF